MNTVNINNQENLTNLKKVIEQSFETRATITHANATSELTHCIDTVLNLLNNGTLRIAEKINNTWQVNQWLKKAVLLSFRIYDNKIINADHCQYYDKVSLKYNNLNNKQFSDQQVRIVPGAVARFGSYIGPNTVVMPSFVNIGAYIDAGCMLDTWATVGSCAQIGKNVHLSGGAGIGGVLEPLQANPTIIEDNCFIGARSEVVEGVIVGRGSVISMGVFLGQSTKI
jgi:2,3,4,5-tetrahydropyridine-2-carboxylate N-succinyltransferase